MKTAQAQCSFNTCIQEGERVEEQFIFDRYLSELGDSQGLNGAKEVRMPKAAEVIANSIRKLIIKGDLKPGEYLPSETDLMVRFNASHAVMREAFRILEVEHFISISRGARKGAKIQLPKADMVARYASYVLQAQGATLSEVYEARNAVGPFVARLLAQDNALEHAELLSAEIKRIRALYDAGDVVAYRGEATRFDLFMVNLAGNEVLSLIYLLMEEVFEGVQLSFPTPPSLSSEIAVNQTIAWWFESTEKLVKYIRRADASRAERHWRDHLQRLSELWQSAPIDRPLTDMLQ